MKAYRTVVVVGIILAVQTLGVQAVAAEHSVAAEAVHATDMFSPGLPASATQFLTCRIVNVTNVTQTVTSQGFISTGAPGTGPVTQTLAPGEAGGFSVSGTAHVIYCKFIVTGSATGFRASIEVFDPASQNIAVALPAF